MEGGYHYYENEGFRSGRLPTIINYILLRPTKLSILTIVQHSCTEADNFLF